MSNLDKVCKADFFIMTVVLPSPFLYLYIIYSIFMNIYIKFMNVYNLQRVNSFIKKAVYARHSLSTIEGNKMEI